MGAHPYSLIELVKSQHPGDADLWRPGMAKREQTASDCIAASVVAPLGGLMRGGVFLPVGQDARSFTSTDFLATSLQSLHRALRPALHLNTLGAATVELSGSREALAVGVPAIAAGGYATENSDAVETTSTFSGCSLAPADAYCRTTITRRLLRSSAAESTLRDLMQRTIRATVEQGVLAGTGANGQPLGLLNSGALQQQATAGAVPTLSEAAQAVESVLLADGDLSSVAWLFPAADFNPLMTALHGAPTNVIPDSAAPFNLCGMPVFFSRFIPSGRWICADWSQLTIGFWGAPELIVDKFTMAARGTTALTVWQTVASGVGNRDTFVIGKAA